MTDMTISSNFKKLTTPYQTYKKNKKMQTPGMDDTMKQFFFLIHIYVIEIKMHISRLYN